MSRKAKTIRPYLVHLERVRNARSILLAAFLLTVLVLVALLTSPVGVALGLGTFTIAVILFVYACSAPCPMCGRFFYFRLVQDRCLRGRFVRETTIFEAEPRCVNCGFVPEANT